MAPPGGAASIQRPALAVGEVGALHAPELVEVEPQRGQGTIELRVADVVEGEQFVDEAEVAGTVVRTTHRVDPLPDGDGARILYRLESSGPMAEEIGPVVSADFPETLAALAEHVTR